MRKGKDNDLHDANIVAAVFEKKDKWQFLIAFT